MNFGDTRYMIVLIKHRYRRRGNTIKTIQNIVVRNRRFAGMAGKYIIL
jgi:hypothetical protein